MKKNLKIWKSKIAAACDVIYVAAVAMETNYTPRDFNYWKVQREFIICAKYQVNWLSTWCQK